MILPTIDQIFKQFDLNNIKYCHWKSNIRLDEAVSGKTDLDLLVDRSQTLIFEKVLLNFNIIKLKAPKFKQYPSMEDYLGYDRQTGNLFHLHIHYRLILGEKHFKGHFIPIEQQYLHSAFSDPKYNLKVPDPQLELAVLVVRILFKTDMRQLLSAMVKRGSPVPIALEKEIQFLLKQIDNENLFKEIKETVPELPYEIIEEYLELRTQKKLTSKQLFRLKRKMLKFFIQYRWISTGANWIKLFVSKVIKIFSWNFLSRKKLEKGGLTIAIIGSDGAGKSTVISDIIPWLGWKIDVQSFYMGSKINSLKTKIIKNFRINSKRIAKLIHLISFKKRNFLTEKAYSIAEYFEFLHLVYLGKDRRDRFKQGCAQAILGKLIFFDRFPLPELYEFMDGPSQDKNLSSKFPELDRLEKSQYEEIKMPDHIIALHVEPETALHRKPDHNSDIVKAKAKAISGLSDNKIQMTHIDANRPYEAVIRDVKDAIWRLI